MRYIGSSAARSANSVRGFSLMEIMIVLAIVAILSAIALPSYNASVQRSRRADAKNALLDLAAREEKYFAVNNSYTSVALNLYCGSTTSGTSTCAASFPMGVGTSGNYDYNVTVTSATTTAFTATATPVAGGTQVSDACYEYLINQLGAQSNLSASGAAVTLTGNNSCW